MHPILFTVFSFEARSYYVLWASALLLFVFWTKARATRRYGLDGDAVLSVLVWVYAAGILGAALGGIIEKIPLIIMGREPLRFLLHGGLTSAPGIVCGGLAGIYRSRRLQVSAETFADAASIPFAAMMALGRCGCFLEGCCTGVGAVCAERPWWGVHFPSDALSFYRYPSQFSETIAALLIMAFLIAVERADISRAEKRKGAVLFPLFLILYGFYRLIFDFFREPDPLSAFNSGHLMSVAAVVVGAAWFFHTFKNTAAQN